MNSLPAELQGKPRFLHLLVIDVTSSHDLAFLSHGFLLCETEIILVSQARCKWKQKVCVQTFYIGCNYYFYSQYVLNHLESFLSVVRTLTGFTFQFFPFDVYKSLKIFSVVV